MVPTVHVKELFEKNLLNWYICLNLNCTWIVRMTFLGQLKNARQHKLPSFNWLRHYQIWTFFISNQFFFYTIQLIDKSEFCFDFFSFFSLIVNCRSKSTLLNWSHWMCWVHGLKFEMQMINCISMSQSMQYDFHFQYNVIPKLRTLI